MFKLFWRLGVAGLMLSVVVGPTALAQSSLVLETNAPSVKWYQLNTPNFRVLYPTGFEAQAQRVANTLETVRDPESKTMGASPKKISIILQNQSSLSNGFVTMAPRRSEFYTMPTQDYTFIGTNDWLNNLVTHEYRHIVQFQRSITGFNKLVYYALGQQAAAGFAFAAAPQWFWEGDAVATETAFTESGRGRIQKFDLLFRTNLMEGRTFNYHKQYLRSYKDNIPDHYVLGYNMVAHLRKKTGDPMIWEKVVGRSWDVPFIPFAFSNALKKETGMYVTDLYRDMAAQRKKDYEEAVANLQFSPFERLNVRGSTAYTDYLYPQALSDGSVVVNKSGIGDIDQLVFIANKGKVERKFVQGMVNGAGMLSASQQRVVWNEFRYDARWLVHNYSVVRGYDFAAKKAHVLSGRSRYSAAAISPDGKLVATIETTNDYKIRLVILDFASGTVLQTIENPSNELLAMPRWTDDGKGIVLLRTSGEGKTISRIELSSGTVSEILPRSLENVGYPVPFGDYVLFNAPAGGIDNVHAVNVRTHQRFQVTTSRYGAYNPSVSPDGKIIYYNDQTRNGMDVVWIPFDTTIWKSYTPEVSTPNLNYEHLVEQEGSRNILKEVTSNTYTPQRYRRISGMINPHSWGPYFTNSLTRVDIGIASRDIMSTTNIFGGYEFDLNERTGLWKVNLSYQGIGPIIDFNVIWADRSVHEGTLTTKVTNADSTTYMNQDLVFKWNERTVETGLRLPLLTTVSKFHSQFEIGNYVGLTHVTDFSNTINNSRVIPSVITDGKVQGVYTFFSYPANGNLYYNHFYTSAYYLLKRSRRDINSKWGMEFYLDVFGTPYGGDYTGSQTSLYGIGYVPGLFKHHSLWGYLAYQKSQIDQLYYTDTTQTAVADNMSYQFRNQIPLPRGQSLPRFKNMTSMSVNYTMPIWYPDVAVGPLVNFQRLRANVFFDYAQGSSAFANSTVSQKYSSVGGELKLDLNVMRFLPQFNVGIRYSYGISPRTTLFEILIGSFNF